MQFDTGFLQASVLRNVAAALMVAVATTGCFEEGDEQIEDISSIVNEAPTIAVSPLDLQVIAGQPVLVKPSASDPDGDPLTFAIAGKPAWANFDSQSGTLTGTPGDADAGTYSGIVISVTDGSKTAVAPDLRVMVQASTTNPTPTPPSNGAPRISGTPGTAVIEGQAYSFTPSASDPDGQPLTFSIANRPSWASFSAGSGQLAGTPPIGAAGSYMNIVISVSDGIASTSLPAFTIVVERANRAPVVTGLPVTSVREGQGYSFQPGASDPDGDAVSFSISNKPAWAAFNTATGLLSGTPPAGSAGTYSNIVISVSDGRLSSSLPAFSIAVTANRAPTISGTPATKATVGQAYSFTPSASDPDGQSLSFSIANKPAWASFSTSTGRLSGTPTTSHVGVSSGIVISVSDGMSATSLASFSIEVSAENGAPTIGGTPTTTAREGQAYSFTPTASDPEGDTLTFSIANKPSWADFSTSTGALTGTPPTGSAGTYGNIIISVSDGKVTKSMAAFSITVQQASNGSVTLSWQAPDSRTDGSTLTNLAGYRIKYGTTSGSYPNVVTLNNPGLTSYVVENLPPATYYFVMSAIDSAGVESANTNPVSKTVQ
jgi:hypothetical protein